MAISISDEAGRQVYSSEKNGGKQIKLDVSGFPQGFYFLTIKTGNNNPAVVYKLVK
jgi:hypothetical protein